MKIFVILCVGIAFGIIWEGSQLRAQRSLPLGEARIIRAGRVSPEDRVPIWAYGEIYAALGMTSKMFSDWEDRYGMDSLGVGDGGQLLIPGFPVFSKVAGTYVDPVDLSDSETVALVLECERAVSVAHDQSVQDTFRQIHNLAMKAIGESATVHFGPRYSS